MTNEVPEPERAAPWSAGDGPEPVVWTWPKNDRPALRVWSAGQWRYAPVLARQNWADGSVRYQVEVDLLGDTRVMVCLYQWPQPGLRTAHGSSVKPSRGVDEERQGDMPRPRPRRS
ncbi:hypothetical protein ACFT38_28220 [Streptomyces sp. NPDC056975]|uniref:hypothetical protein n=1 Tax=Streptomyces sp. NPDC056975 TaxID=3345985 RepID=UPI003627035E